ncbi:MAG: phosphate starvation-inducible protein [Methyloceanibacter sp.]|nr:MAG: phosphate starvation-inducible protein [Methyloceanibacter sp.]GKS59926.1 phosphate starvation-inducible protein [Nitrospira sp.]
MRKLKLREGINTAVLFGYHDRHLKLVEGELGVRMSARGEELLIEGSPEAERKAEQIMNDLAALITQGYDLRPDDVQVALAALRHGSEGSVKEFLGNPIAIATRKRAVAPKTPAQRLYVEAIEKYDIVIGIGPAGTGKTYLAMAMAVQALARREVSRIILARPAVEAGEKLGFLPGDMFAKVNPYLRPLHDALYDMMDLERANRMMERGEIEIAPLAFMRGRTLNDSFVILDEAQNATAEQMKMFLTRLGNNSKAVVTGDITQVDLPNDRVSGLVEIIDILKEIQGIQFVYFDEKDVVRHRLVQDIIRAYDRHHSAKKQDGPAHHGRGQGATTTRKSRQSFPPALPLHQKSSRGQSH